MAKTQMNRRMTRLLYRFVFFPLFATFGPFVGVAWISFPIINNLARLRAHRIRIRLSAAPHHCAGTEHETGPHQEYSEVQQTGKPNQFGQSNGPGFDVSGLQASYPPLEPIQPPVAGH
jgi:hypothetical protein